jgi:EAL domain-containing protein (putative c-di-GMP-specific phosphodiesterase class I)
MLTTAEGVETSEQLEQLVTLGCIEAQGYYFGRAQPAAQILPPRVALAAKDGAPQAA